MRALRTFLVHDAAMTDEEQPSGQVRSTVWWWGLWAMVLVLVFLAALALVTDNIFTSTARGVASTASEGFSGLSVVEAAGVVQSITDVRAGAIFAISGFIALTVVLVLLAKHRLGRKEAARDREKPASGRGVEGVSRYAKAIKELGDDSPAIRLGGIHALERIAENSQRDRQPILDVLWAYLRSESPLKKSSGAAAGKMKSDAAAAAVAAGRITHLSRPTKLTILPGVNLSGAILDGADLSDASFDGANLTGASFDGANLDGASFIGADLTGASLNDANLNLANLNLANLSGVDLIGADLSAADLTGANLTGARLLDTNLTGAGLTSAVLTGARFARAHLAGTYILEMTEDKMVGVPVSRKYLKDKGVKGLQTVKGLPG